MHEHPHVHPKQPDLEDAPFIEYPVMAQTLANLLIDQAIITADGMQKGIEAMDASSPRRRARLVARCWVDSAFETRVLQSTNTTAVELGLNLCDADPGGQNYAPCPYCHCVHPVLLLSGSTLRQKTYWNKSRAYRSRIVREPRAVLAAFGTSFPTTSKYASTTARLNVAISSFRCVPRAQAGMTEVELTACVTHDCIIGWRFHAFRGNQSQGRWGEKVF